MISKELFCKVLQLLKEQDAIDEEFGNALQKMGNGFFVFGSENKYREALLMLLKEAAHDQYDWYHILIPTSFQFILKIRT